MIIFLLSSLCLSNSFCCINLAVILFSLWLLKLLKLYFHYYIILPHLRLFFRFLLMLTLPLLLSLYLAFVGYAFPAPLFLTFLYHCVWNLFFKYTVPNRVYIELSLTTSVLQWNSPVYLHLMAVDNTLVLPTLLFYYLFYFADSSGFMKLSLLSLFLISFWVLPHFSILHMLIISHIFY